MEDITWEAENYLPGADPETGIPNGSVRTYGYWSGTNTASGKSFRGLWYHYLTFNEEGKIINGGDFGDCLLYTSPSPRDAHESRMPSSA